MNFTDRINELELLRNALSKKRRSFVVICPMLLFIIAFHLLPYFMMRSIISCELI